MYASALTESIHDEIELGGFGRLLALTHNDEVNSLATLHFAEVFGRANVFQLHPHEEENSLREVVPMPLRGRLLFGPAITCDRLTKKFETGFELKSTPITEQFNYNAFKDLYSSSAIPLFVIDENHNLLVFTVDQKPVPRPGQTLISFVSPGSETTEKTQLLDPVVRT
jgi:hypothetical protein